MKKFFGILFLSVVMMTILAIGAFADEVGGMNFTSADVTDGWTQAVDGCSFTRDTNEKFSLTYSGTDLKAGEPYAMLIVKYDKNATTGAITYSVSDSTIMYIDQTNASGTTPSVSFTNFIPKSTPDSLVLLGGTFDNNVTGPKVIGAITGHGNRVIGTVGYLGAVTMPAVTLTDSTGTEYRADVEAPQNGVSEYSFSAVPDGSYTLSISKSGHKTCTKTAISIDADHVEMDAVALLGGDVDNDGGVTLSDISSILTAFGQNGSGIVIKSNDIDEDGGITLTDLSTTLTNFGK